MWQLSSENSVTFQLTESVTRFYLVRDKIEKMEYYWQDVSQKVPLGILVVF